jgi:hypothetical protein
MKKNKIAIVTPVAGILILAGLAAIPSIHRSQGSAMGPCDLTISADPSKGSLAAGQTIDVKVSGKLTCGGVVAVNHPIAVTRVGTVNTDTDGNYHATIPVSAGTHKTITARYTSTSPEDSASASTTIDFNEKS